MTVPQDQIHAENQMVFFSYNIKMLQSGTR